MAKKPPDWHLYRAFLAVMREGSLSGAARAIGTTQPTVGRQIAALYAHRRYLANRGMPPGRDALVAHALIGSDRDPAFARLIDAWRLPRDAFAFRSDSQLAQLATLRAGLGIGVCQLGIAGRDAELIPVLHAELMFSMDTWLAMHRDLRGNQRVRLVFDHIATEMAAYAQGSGRSG